MMALQPELPPVNLFAVAPERQTTPQKLVEIDISHFADLKAWKEVRLPQISCHCDLLGKAINTTY